MDNCRHCNVELVAGYKAEGGNWSPYYAKKKWKICKACFNKHHMRGKYLSRNTNRMYVNGKYVPQSHPWYKPGRYKTFNAAWGKKFDNTYKIDSIKEGYVYAITNPAWPEWVKIGMAIDADDRCNGYQTSSPFRDYSLEHVVASNNRRVSESQAHTAAAKIAEEQKGEWFRISIEQAKDILNKISVKFKKAG